MTDITTIETLYRIRKFDIKPTDNEGFTALSVAIEALSVDLKCPYCLCFLPNELVSGAKLRVEENRYCFNCSNRLFKKGGEDNG